jgi:hypothetical protein
VTFSADPSSIRWGEGAKLSWSVADASSAAIDHGVGEVGSSGEQTVRPGKTTTYTLTAANSFGKSTATVTVSVSAQPPGGLGILDATVNPILVSSAGETGSTTLRWTAPAAVQEVELRINAPDGQLLISGGPNGAADAGPWVSDGMTFYLQDVTSGKPLTVANTLDTLVVRVVRAGAPFLSASPLYIPIGKSTGSTWFAWNAPGASSVQLFANSAGGVQVTGDLPASGSALIGDWVVDGQPFFLQEGAGEGNTVAQTRVSTEPGVAPAPPPAAASGVEFTADPNPVQAEPGRTTGKTRLSWKAPAYPRLVIYAGRQQLTGELPSEGSLDTPDWVSDGLVFTLRDATKGAGDGAGEVLATVVIRVRLSSSAPALDAPVIGGSGMRWSAVPGAIGYEVEVDTWTAAGWCSETPACRTARSPESGTAATAAAGRNSRWRVRALGEQGSSLWTSWRENR